MLCRSKRQVGKKNKHKNLTSKRVSLLFIHIMPQQMAAMSVSITHNNVNINFETKTFKNKSQFS